MNTRADAVGKFGPTAHGKYIFLLQKVVKPFILDSVFTYVYISDHTDI
jgi:hypothetical protein